MAQSKRTASKTTATSKTSPPSSPPAPLSLQELIAAIEQHKQQEEMRKKELEELEAAAYSIEVYLNRNNFLLNTGVVLGLVGKTFPTNIPGVPPGTSLEGLKIRVSMTEGQFARLGGRVEEVMSSTGKAHRGVLDTGFKVLLQGDDYCVTADLQEPGLLWLQCSCVKVIKSTPWAGATPVSATGDEIAEAIRIAREGTQRALAARRQRMQDQQQEQQQQINFDNMDLG